MGIKYLINTIEEEQVRIDETLARFEFYKNIGMKPILPKTTLKEEYNPEKYDQVIKKLTDINFEEFFKKLELYFNTKKDIIVKFTAYGSGGSYRPQDNSILINLENADLSHILKTIKHEIIHLYIHDFEQEMGYTHQEKEDLVKQLEEVFN